MEHYGQWSGGKHHVSCHFTQKTKMCMWGKEGGRGRYFLDLNEEATQGCQENSVFSLILPLTV